MKPGETQWQWLPDGLECQWRDDRQLFKWHVVILAELLVGAASVIVVSARRWQHATTAVPCLLVFAYLTPMAIRAVLRGIRDQPWRLRATVSDGLSLWEAPTGRPRLAVPHSAIADLRIESDPWGLFWRSWRLVIVLKKRWPIRRVLFSSDERGSLDGTCQALRSALKLTESRS